MPFWAHQHQQSAAQTFAESFHDVVHLITIVSVVYLSIVLMVNYLQLPIWAWFIINLALLVMAIVLAAWRSRSSALSRPSAFDSDYVTGSQSELDIKSLIRNYNAHVRRFNSYVHKYNFSIHVGVETNFLAMVAGATLVYVLAGSLHIVVRVVLACITLFICNMIMHLFYNEVVISFHKTKSGPTANIPEEKTVRDIWD